MNEAIKQRAQWTEQELVSHYHGLGEILRVALRPGQAKSGNFPQDKREGKEVAGSIKAL